MNDSDNFFSEEKEKNAIVLTSEDLNAKQIISIQELLDSEIKLPEWVVNKLIPERGMVIFAGASGMFKSYFAMYVACCIATGKPVLDTFDTKKQPVLYIDEENDLSTVKERFLKLKRGTGISAADLERIHLMHFKSFKIEENEIDKLDAILHEKEIRFVVIDSLIRVFEGDENSSEAARKLFHLIKSLTKKYSVTFLILHHCRKGEGANKDDVRGSSEFAAAATSVVIITSPSKNLYKLRQEKSRIALNEFEEIQFIVKDEKDQEGNDVILLSYSGANKVARSAQESAELRLLEWIAMYSPKEFMSSEAYALGPKNAINDALKNLEAKGKLEKMQRGHWKVIA